MEQQECGGVLSALFSHISILAYCYGEKFLAEGCPSHILRKLRPSRTLIFDPYIEGIDFLLLPYNLRLRGKHITKRLLAWPAFIYLAKYFSI